MPHLFLTMHLQVLNSWFDTFDMAKPNSPRTIVRSYEKRLGLTFVRDSDEAGNVCMLNEREVRNDYRVSFSAMDFMDYLYGVVHTPPYENPYRDLSILDFSRLPYPVDTETFWSMAYWGGELRKAHVLEPSKVDPNRAALNGNGRAVTTAKIIENTWELLDARSKVGRVRVNRSQFLDNIPLETWEFKMGGQRPAQKWLLDRQGRTLQPDDLEEYQKLISALLETHRIMRQLTTV